MFLVICRGKSPLDLINQLVEGAIPFIFGFHTLSMLKAAWFTRKIRTQAGQNEYNL